MELARRFRLSKKGFMFVLDALLASMILVGGLLLISQHLLTERPKENMEYLTTDMLSVLYELKMSDINLTDINYVNYLNTTCNNTNMNLSIIEQVGSYWALSVSPGDRQDNCSKNLSNYVLTNLFPKKMGFNMSMNITLVFNQSLAYENYSSLVAGQRMITGIKENVNALTGATSSAYLQRIYDKRTSSFAYFGGFVGQGNISVFLDGIPDDVGPEDITKMVMEADAGNNFTLKINGVTCKNLNASDTIMSPDLWDISDCNGSIVQGRNTISIIFQGDLNESYIAGGYIRVDYKTDVLQSNFSVGTKTYYFPEIEGIINLYDSIYAPGVINSWIINISFFNNYTTYLVIGNETIFSAEGKNYTQNLIYSKTGLNINPSTIPIRLGTMNFSNVTQIITGEAADTVLVTDTSGSMGDCGELTTQLMCGYDCCIYWWLGWWCPGSRECIHPGTCNNSECGACSSGYTARNYDTWTETNCLKTKMDIAKDADKTAVDIILNSSANNMGLVSYSTSVNAVAALTKDKAGLKSSIDSYNATGGTCTCCGINRAKDLVLSSSQKKFMIVLSDGDPTFYCNSFSDYSGSGTRGDGTGGSSSQTDRNWSIWAGQNACSNNITVFTIGFGTSMSAEGHDTMRRTACNDSLYFNATNVSLLSDIYRNISDMILSYANYTSQTVTIIGNITYSKLNPGSFIELNYTPIVEAPQPNEISIEVQTPQFNNCSENIIMPSGIRILDAKVTSYSGKHWTKTLMINSAVVYSLTNYGADYRALGDPYTIQAPSVLLGNGTNTIFIDTGDNSTNSTGCSKNNSLIYTALIPSSTARSSVVQNTIGCNWTIQFVDDTFSNKIIPVGCSGAIPCPRCSYTAANHTLENNSYDPTDAYDIAVFNLLKELDFNDNGKIFVNLDATDIEIVITTVSSVPYLWGPTLVKARVWQ